MGMIYLFLDAGHLETSMTETLSVFAGTPFELDFIDYTKVAEFTGAERTFYYHGFDLDENDEEEMEKQKERIAKGTMHVNSLLLLPDFHVRPGSIQGKLGKRPRRQKEVDVQLTVDVLSNVFNRNCSEVILITGDLDFRPLVEAVVGLGTRITIYSAPGRTNEQLKFAPDRWKPLGLAELHQMTTGTYQLRYPIPVSQNENSMNLHARRITPVDYGKTDEYYVYLGIDRSQKRNKHFVFIDSDEPDYPHGHAGELIYGKSESVVRGFVKLEQRGIEWTGMPWIQNTEDLE